MSEKIQCVVLNRLAEPLGTAPWPGDLGQRILREVSREGWQQWLSRQTMLMNEQRLSPINPEHRAYLEAQMTAFLFGDGGDQPEGWVAPESEQN
ncbi:MAG: oxidative damage protection protein [Arenicellales bacterium]